MGLIRENFREQFFNLISESDCILISAFHAHDRDLLSALSKKYCLVIVEAQNWRGKWQKGGYKYIWQRLKHGFYPNAKSILPVLPYLPYKYYGLTNTPKLEEPILQYEEKGKMLHSKGAIFLKMKGQYLTPHALWIGSMNFTEKGFDENHELCCLFKGNEAVTEGKTFMEHFTGLLEASRAIRELKPDVLRMVG